MTSPSTPHGASLDDFAEFFAALGEAGLSCLVIGGCAVGAYARHIGETVLSQDLDLYMTVPGLEAMLDVSDALPASVEKRPRPRSLPVAVFRWRGLEVNVLTETPGMPPADAAMRSGRELVLARGTNILVADPCDLLRNKLAVHRDKDMAHISILRRFLEEEAVHAFEHETEPRARIAPAERLLSVLGTHTIEEPLAGRLLARARSPVDYRFLAHRLPSKEMVDALAEQAPSPNLHAVVVAVAKRRVFF